MKNLNKGIWSQWYILISEKGEFMYLIHDGCRFEEQEVPASRSFFTEIIASISDIKFAKDGRYILSRDYMTLKVCTFCFSSFFHESFEPEIGSQSLEQKNVSHL